MTNSPNSIRRTIATTIQRAPWLAYTARALWRIRQARFTAGVVGVVFNAQGQILLVEHVFHPHFPWGLPGGWMDRHENPTQTIQRELREELELEVVVGMVLLAEMESANHLDLAFLCQAQGSVGRLSFELLDYRWIMPADLPALYRFHQRAVSSALAVRAPGSPQ
jgi:ADP-ribose pyrophosphatase YjhB (NUDIX family)